MAIQKQGYYQALGVLKGTLDKIVEEGRKDFFWLTHNGRRYPVVNPRNRFLYKTDDDWLKRERLYLVYPNSRFLKAYDLLRSARGEEAKAELQNAKECLLELIYGDEWTKSFVEERIPELLIGDTISHLFDASQPKRESLDNNHTAASVLRVLNGAISNDRSSEFAKKKALETLDLLNYCFCDRLYHPDSEKPELSLRFQRQSTNVKPSQSAQPSFIHKWNKEVMFSCLSFTLIAYSDEDHFVYKEDGSILRDGEFLLGGEWRTWKKNPSRATFKSRVNQDTCVPHKSFSFGAIRPVILDARSKIDTLPFEGECLGRSKAKFRSDNTFEIESFEPFDSIKKPLSSADLSKVRKEKKQSKPVKSQKRKPKPKPKLKPKKTGRVFRLTQKPVK